MDEITEPSDQGKQAGKPGSVMDGARIISYNLREDERPEGYKIRFKIRIETGKKAQAIDARQAQAIKEYLAWVRHYRSSGQQAASPRQDQGR